MRLGVTTPRKKGTGVSGFLLFFPFPIIFVFLFPVCNLFRSNGVGDIVFSNEYEIRPL